MLRREEEIKTTEAQAYRRRVATHAPASCGCASRRRVRRLRSSCACRRLPAATASSPTGLWWSHRASEIISASTAATKGTCRPAMAPDLLVSRSYWRLTGDLPATYRPLHPDLEGQWRLAACWQLAAMAKGGSCSDSARSDSLRASGSGDVTPFGMLGAFLAHLEERVCLSLFDNVNQCESSAHRRACLLDSRPSVKRGAGLIILEVFRKIV